MKLTDKIKWRLQFIIKQAKGKRLKVLFYSILPSRSRLAERIIEREIKKCPLVKIEKLGEDDLVFDMEMMKIIYPRNLNLASVTGVYFDLVYPYLKKEGEKISLLDFFPVHEGIYERGNVKLEKGDWIIDAGAYMGMFSIYASPKAGEKGKIFAFEPILETQKLLKRNIELNGIKNVEVLPLALGEKKAGLDFSTPVRNLGNSSAVFDYKGKVEKVNQISLDEFVEENKIHKIDFIKADIEGMERRLLAGAENTIKRFKPKIAICSYHLPDDPEVLTKMIKDFVPEYKIIKGEKKIFAYL